MTELETHRGFVEAWVDRTCAGAASPRLLELLAQSVAAIWGRAQQTLGDVTLQAVAERVAFHARARFGLVLAITVDAEGVTFSPAPGAAAPTEDQLRQATRFVLVELLTVLGNLTAGVLTPPLHAALGRVGANGAGGTTQKGVDVVVDVRPGPEEGTS